MFFISFLLINLSAQVVVSEPGNIDSLKMKIKVSKEDTLLVSLYNDLAWEYSFNDFDSAEKYTDQAILLADKMKNLYWQAVSYEMKAMLFEISGQQENAIKLYMEVIDLHENLGGKGLENTFNNLAILFRNQKNHQKALEYFGKSYEMELKLDNNRGVIGSLINMAVSLKDLGQIDSAFTLTKRALEMAKLKDDKEYIIYSSINLAKHYYDKGNPDSVLFYNRSVIDISRELEMYGPLATILQMIADVFIDRKQFQEALEYLNEAEVLATKINTKEMLISNYQSKAKAFAGLQNFNQAYDNLWKYIYINDSLINNHSIEVLNDLEKKYETAKKDQSIAQLNELNARNELKAERQESISQVLIFSSAFLIIFALLIVWFLRQRLKNQELLALKNEEITTTNFQRKLTELELKALRSQMNPHFIFNCMNSINTMILNGESEEASRYLNKFSKLIRLTLENSEQTTITLENELSMLETYIHLEAVRFQGKIQYEITVDPSIDPSEIRLPSLVLQPFIENAIWHGLMHKKEPGSIKIKFKEEGDDLKCTIEDDGIGRKMALKMTENIPEKSRSMGIKLTEERLKLISKNKITEWVQVIDLKDPFDKAIGTRVNIIIPIN